MRTIFGGAAYAREVDKDFGVASGDPGSDSITLWTRIPESFQSTGPVDVSCVLATSVDFAAASIVSTLNLSTDDRSDYTVRLRAAGLEPQTTYYYKFESETGYRSVVGRTKTAPAPDSLSPVRFAVVSCQNYSQGYFLSYHAIAAGNYDFILHLGDFIYEKGASDVRSDAIGGGEAKTLEDYRAKYKLYLSDPYLKEARRLFPFVHLWDDHEVVNNYAGPDIATADLPRMDAGYQAFFEYNPVPGTITRNGGVPTAQMARSLKFGAWLELFALDQRQFRDPVVCGRDMVVPRCDDALAPDRTMLGKDQNRWFLDSMAQSNSSWKFIASELMMMPVRTPKLPFLNRRESSEAELSDTFLTLDSWDGYPAERQRIVSELAQRQIRDIVVCSGDIHNFFGGSVHLSPDDARSPVVAAELTTSSITSKGMTDWLGGVGTAIMRPGILSRSPHLQFMDLKYHGHIEVEVNGETVSGRMIAMDTVRSENGKPFVLKQFGMRRGQSRMTFT